MSRSAWNTDEELLLELASILRRVEAPPDDVVWQAREAFAWRNIAAQVAALEYDSVIDDDEPFARVRGSADERVLRFKAATAGANLVVDSARRLVGRLEPPAYRAVEVRQPSGSSIVEIDASGCFLVERVRHGLMSLRFLPADPEDAPFETEWVSV